MGLEKIQAALEDPDKNTVDLGLVDDEEDDETGEEETTSVKETASTLFVTEKSAGEEVTKSEKRKRAVDEVEVDILDHGDSEPVQKKEKRT